jgi:hypothetical protein
MIESSARPIDPDRRAYTIKRDSGGGDPAYAEVIVLFEGEPVTHVVHHSPTGLEYGYSGSGPTDLALTLLCHVFGVNPITFAEQVRGRLTPDPMTDNLWRLRCPFRDHFISRLDGEIGEHEITRHDIMEWLKAH